MEPVKILFMLVPNGGYCSFNGDENMKKFLKKSVAIALIAGLYTSQVLAASLPSYTLSTATVPGNIPDMNSLVSSINANVTPATMGNSLNFRNILDNGSFGVAQRGTSAFAGGTTSSSVYGGPDRWAVNTNVSSGAGYGQVVTSSPTPAPGFSNAFKVYRNSGSLAQPVCTIQEVPTADAVALQGQQATFSAYLQALTGLSADNGNAANLYIFTGTGSDQGLQTLTASPAITPVWANIATSGSASVTLTTSWARYSVTATIPTATTEIAVAACFTPTTTSSGGSTDGFAIDGAQLENGAQVSNFEFRPYEVELLKSEKYFWQVNEPAASTNTGIWGAAASSTACYATVPFPVTMRIAPTLTASTVTSGTTWQAIAAGVAANTSAIAVYTGNTVNNGNLNITTTGMTAGQACGLQGKGGSAYLQFSADF